ncbi:MAG TPA: TIGR03435 family protein [Vicinamibacterales bacterium]|jgi:uncharacterized protein (TIGR03435 family)
MLNETLNRNRMRGTTFIASAVLLSTVAAHPAGQQSEPTFEVASIKENRSGTNRVSMNVLPGGRLVATNISLETLVAGAYGGDTPLPPNRVVMPAAWARPTAPRFDIEAKPARRFAPGELLVAVRHLLEDRFKLVVHHERREQPGYALVVDRADRPLGPRLKRSDVDCTDPVQTAAKEVDGTLRCGIRGRPGSATGRHTMAVLARFLTNVVPDHRTVADRTNLAGTYDFQIDWAPEVPVPSDGAPAPVDPDAVSVFTAAREQLGLRLDSEKQQVDVLIVDRAERPTEN